MQGAIKFGLAYAFAALTLSTVPLPLARGQQAEITLLDANNMGDWDRQGDSNWRFENGAVIADKKASKPPGYLVSKQQFKDFVLHVEFWASDDANSGIYIRCSNPKDINAHACYEINIFDRAPDPTYGTGAINHFVEVDPMPKAGGKWNTYEITAKGRQMTVVLNGQKTAELRNNLWMAGPIALQHDAGTIKFRKVVVKPL